jgi:DNA-binding response OmpR family regulator
VQGGSPRALVVDDDAALRLLSRVNLELEGFDVRDAATAAEARILVDEQHPDVVLLDLHLGDGHSGDLAVWLRGLGIPVALVTGSVEASQVDVTADAVLLKPYEPRDLVATARRLARVDS